MTWIDEMFTTMENDRAAASARRAARETHNTKTGHLKTQGPTAQKAWTALLASLSHDLAEFNGHRKRSGQPAVSMFQKPYHCEVYLPGMHSKRLVVGLENDKLIVTVYPDFPDQPLTIAIETGGPDHHGFWVLGDPAKAGSNLPCNSCPSTCSSPS